jgi:hypothetical protein
MSERSAKSRLLFWGYSYHQERNFKNLRERRSTIRRELMEDALRAGMILHNRADDTLTNGHRHSLIL